jgi:alpha-galactosidase
MHGRLWANDPDCLLARDTRTKLTLPEVRSLATPIALSGGMVLPSDDLSQLSGERLDIVSLLLPALGEAATVPDLLESDMPARMELEVGRPFESWRLLAAFNWSGRRRELRVALPPGRWHAFELWEARYWGAHEDELTLPDTPAHGVRLLALRKALRRPQLLGTTFHVSLGAREIEDATWDGRRRTLRMRLTPVAKPTGEVLVHVPPGYTFAAATLDGRPIEPRRPQQPVLAFAFELRQPRELVIQFERSHRGRMAAR